MTNKSYSGTIILHPPKSKTLTDSVALGGRSSFGETCKLPYEIWVGVTRWERVWYNKSDAVYSNGYLHGVLHYKEVRALKKRHANISLQEDVNQKNIGVFLSKETRITSLMKSPNRNAQLIRELKGELDEIINQMNDDALRELVRVKCLRIKKYEIIMKTKRQDRFEFVRSQYEARQRELRDKLAGLSTRGEFLSGRDGELEKVFSKLDERASALAERERKRDEMAAVIAGARRDARMLPRGNKDERNVARAMRLRINEDVARSMDISDGIRDDKVIYARDLRDAKRARRDLEGEFRSLFKSTQHTYTALKRPCRTLEEITPRRMRNVYLHPLPQLKKSNYEQESKKEE